MGMVRSDVLPPGRYWYHVLPEERGQWSAWVAQQTVNQVVTQGGSEDHPIVWSLFQVVSPTPWTMQGYPNTADESVQTEEDVITAPDPQTTGEYWADALDVAIPSLVYVGAGALVLAWLARRS